MSDLDTHWHRQCADTSPETCGVQVTASFEIDGIAQYRPAPDGEDELCFLCGSAWGPWIAGPAPSDEEQE